MTPEKIREMSKRNVRKMRERRRLLGLCQSCGKNKISENSVTRCGKCISKHKVYCNGKRKDRIQNGLCGRCGKILNGKSKTSCNQCDIDGCKRQNNKKIKALQMVSKELIPKCISCGIIDIRILTINHLKGGGSKDNAKNHWHLYRSIVRGSRTLDDLEVRCYNCNILYEYVRGVRKF